VAIITDMRRWTVGLILVSVACLHPRVHTLEVQDGPISVTPPSWLLEEAMGPPPDLPNARYMGKFKTTFYWVVEEADYPSGSSPLYDTRGRLVGRFSRAFIRDFKIEAAARLNDGRCVSYLKSANRVVVSDSFMGYGGYRLSELKSIAVDPRIIPLGARVYIPQAERVVVNGRRLSGIFHAHDIGSAVKGKHVDLFVGSRKNIDVFKSAGIRSLGSVDIYILE
jgi:3D (Asp-Asp-Asp) domain-containing protein